MGRDNKHHGQKAINMDINNSAPACGFDTILGNSHAINCLKTMLLNNKFPHAILFTGPAGVGKHTTARLFAMAVNCLDRDNPPCLECKNCRRFNNNNYPDFIETIAETKSIKIEQIRDACKKLIFRPAEDGMRVWIIADAHLLKEHAANALLKTLEEPQPRNIIILTALGDDSLPDTIRSRCMKLSFYSLPDQLAATIIQKKLGTDSQTALQVANIFGGSPGMAIAVTMDDKTISSFKESLIKLFSYGDKVAIEETLDMAEKISKISDNLPNLLEWGKLLCRDIFLTKHNIDKKHISMYETILSLGDSIGALPGSFFLRIFDAFDETQKAIHENVNPQMAIESLFLKITDQ